MNLEVAPGIEREPVGEDDHVVTPRIPGRGHGESRDATARMGLSAEELRGRKKAGGLSANPSAGQLMTICSQSTLYLAAQ